jgi:hypothetical protein
MQYIQFEKYDTLMEMNGNERTSVDGHLWMDIEWNGNKRRTKRGQTSDEKAKDVKRKFDECHTKVQHMSNKSLTHIERKLDEHQMKV